MKWLLIQSNGEHAANKYLRECWALKHAIEACWHQADVWGLRHENFATVPDFESYDIVLCLEQYEMAWLPDFNKIRKPLKLQWIVDLHCQNPAAYRPITEGCHVILHSTQSLMGPYASTEDSIKKHLWFPNGVDERLLSDSGFYFDKKIDFGFVGSINPERQQWIDRLKAEMPFQAFTVIGRLMIRTIGSMKIHWNICNRDINYRTFETIAIGSCLLTSWDDDLSRLGFIDGVNCLIYRNYEEAISKAKRALVSSDYIHISQEGYKLALRHTYTQRIHELLKQL